MKLLTLADFVFIVTSGEARLNFLPELPLNKMKSSTTQKLTNSLFESINFFYKQPLMLSTKSLLLTGIITLGIQLISASSVTATQQLPPLQLPASTQKLIAATPTNRVALVIGNSKYLEGGNLRNPINDANDMARELRNLGFEVIKVLDGDKRQMNIALDDFTSKVSKGGVGLFYYAGHGISVEGKNYLIPIDAPLRNAKDVDYEVLPLSTVQNAMESTQAGTNIIILDACRNNPFSRKWSRSSRTQMFSIGLSPMQKVQGTFIAFATQPGNVADDGNGKNSPFTSSLLQHIKTPNISIENLFKEVRKSVAKATGNQQVPEDSSSLVSDFSFNPISPDAPPTNPDTATTRLSDDNSSQLDLDEDKAKKYLALSTFTEAIKSRPDYAYAYYARGNVYYDLGDQQAALADYSQAIKLQPDYAYAYYGRGNVYRNLGDKKAALADYNQGIKLQPDYAYAYLGRGNVYYDLGNKEAALADYNQAIKLQPDSADAYNGRGNVYRDLGDKKAALADYNQAIKLQLDYAPAYYARGNVNYDLGNKQAALADYNQAIKLQPDYAYTYYGRGNFYSNLGNKQAALADYNQVIKLQPDYAPAYLSRGNLYYDLGYIQAVLADYNQAIKLQPDYADAYYDRGNFYNYLRNKKAALADYNQAIDLYQTQGNTQGYNNAVNHIKNLGI